ncbi:MAG: YcxB family protein [Pseudomonadota bacterium]
MSHQATLVYAEPLLREAVLAFWRRTVGVGYLVVLIALVLTLGALLVQGQRSWLVGMLATTVALGVAFAALLFAVHHRRALRKLREMGEPLATFRAEAASFTLSSGRGTATLPWSAVKALWQFPEVWLMLYSKAQFSTLPVACLSPEMRAYVVQRIEAAGGKIG